MATTEVAVAVGGDDEEPEPLRKAQHVAQQQQGRLGRPLEVVEHEEDGRLAGELRQPGGDGVEEPVALGLGVRLERGGQAGHPGADLRHEPGQLAAVAAEPVGDGRRMVDEVAQRLDERLVGNAEVLVAPPGQHRRPFVVHRPGQLGRQTGLADPGFAGHEGEAQLAGRRLLPELPEPGQLAVPADEDAADVGQEGRERDR
jgi:hypothetical protein